MATSTASDRLVFTLVISIIIHLIILLGVSFNVFSPPTNAPINNLEITLVKKNENTKPEKADYLAQVNNEGGGELDAPSPTPSKNLPTPKIEEEPASQAPTPVAVAKADPETVLTPVVPLTPQPDVKPDTAEPEVKTQPKKPVEPKPLPPKQKPSEKMVKAITQAKAERKVETTETVGESIQNEAIPIETQPKISARELMLRAHSELEELQDKLDKTSKSLSERPQKRRISASTKEYAAAAYMKAWELKVERIGNMNYPEEAKRKGLNGSLMLSVDINPDGSVPPGGIVISRSSGFKVLDDAAVKIVRLGAPYAAIPEDVLKANDMLTIIRTWKFETNHGLSTR